MNTLGKVVDASVIVGSVVVGYSGVMAISSGITNKKGATIAMGALTLLIGVYALREAYRKINE
jgi:uncharacterized Zn-binding protein involved in type VI secretion